MNYCDVLILDITHSSIDRPFTYKIPKNLSKKIGIASLVKVYFKNQKVSGLVVSVSTTSKLEDKEKIKSVSSLVSEGPVIGSDLLHLAKWMKNYYLCPLSKILRIMLPKGLLINYDSKYYYIVKLNYKNLEKVKIPTNANKQQEILNFLKCKPDNQTIKVADLKKEVGCSMEPIKRLAEREVITVDKKYVYRDPVDYDKLDPYPVKSPTWQQKKVLELVGSEIGKTGDVDFKPVLIYGITGSGKTEVYLHLIEKLIFQGKEVIVLIPEISLTPQTVSRFVGRFGRNVAIIHSRLSVGERYDEWLKILRGEVKIVIGARSAIFAPFSNLGMIIIDEEHENAYKQEDAPRYHAREVAKKRCEINNANLVLGSATPSLESYFEVRKGNYKIARLSSRINNKVPSFKLIDMRKELAGGNRSIFSRDLVKAIKKAIDENDRALLFLNRRGYSTFVLCRNCGYVTKCPNCEVSLTYHKKVDYLRCHYCDYVEPLAKECPDCKSNMIKSFGAGTERIEAEVKKYFPWLKTIRMDVDTTSRKGAHEEILNKFKRKEADILIGTQMIAKGLDFPDISLVGVVSADTILNIPDFRSGEKTYQLLSQVAGRGGRGEKTGDIIIQTYTPEHYSIRAVLEGDYENFASKELDSREKLEYPPFKSMIKFEVKGPNENNVIYSGDALIDILTNIISRTKKDQEGIEILGPHPCPFYKLRGNFRWQIILKGYNFERFKSQIEKSKNIDFEKELSKDVKVVIDVDPVSLL